MFCIPLLPLVRGEGARRLATQGALQGFSLKGSVGGFLLLTQQVFYLLVIDRHVAPCSTVPLSRYPLIIAERHHAGLATADVSEQETGFREYFFKVVAGRHLLALQK